jgi:ribosome-associated protein
MTNPDQYHLNHLFTMPAPDADLVHLSQHLAWIIAQAADDRKAADITVLKITSVSYLSDYLVIATGFSKTQVRAISDAIQEKVEETCHRYPLRVEGKKEGSWVLQDYGDAIVHIFLPQEREFYNLEAFWGHAERIDHPQLDPLRE